jgi:hypothetical protein
MNKRRRWLCGPGGGGRAAVVVGTGGPVVAGGTTGTVVLVEEAPGAVVSARVETGGRALLPLRDATTTATIAPAAATSAMPKKSKAFLTGRQATLAPRWRNGSKSS